MAEPFKLACIGGGGTIVPSVAHGLVHALSAASARGSTPCDIRLALSDAPPERAERLAAYAGLVGTHAGVPLTARAVSTEDALDGADLVLCDATAPEARRRLAEVYAAVGWTPPAHGPGAVAEACATGPFVLRLAREAAVRCPDAPFVTLTAPSDVLAGAARRRYGIAGLRAVGLSAEVEGLRGTLAALLGTPEDQVLLVHGGVDRVGWVVRFAVGGRDGYGELGDRLLALSGDPRLSPADRVIPEVYALTGMIRASARQAWPFVFPGLPEPQQARAEDGRPEALLQAVDAALASGRPIAVPCGAHPERSPLSDPGVGRSVGRMVRAMATGELAVVSLQVPYGGEALGWSPEITVEVPAVVGGPQIEPMAVGPLPTGVDGLPRLLGQQRALASDYLAAPDAAILRRALAATPEWGRADQIRALADALHAAFAADVEAAARA